MVVEAKVSQVTLQTKARPGALIQYDIGLPR